MERTMKNSLKWVAAFATVLAGLCPAGVAHAGAPQLKG